MAHIVRRGLQRASRHRGTLVRGVARAVASIKKNASLATRRPNLEKTHMLNHSAKRVGVAGVVGAAALGVLAVLAGGHSAPAHAQTFPNKTIRLVIPDPPCGCNDVLG